MRTLRKPQPQRLNKNHRRHPRISLREISWCWRNKKPRKLRKRLSILLQEWWENLTVRWNSDRENKVPHPSLEWQIRLHPNNSKTRWPLDRQNKKWKKNLTLWFRIETRSSSWTRVWSSNPSLTWTQTYCNPKLQIGLTWPPRRNRLQFK